MSARSPDVPEVHHAGAPLGAWYRGVLGALRTAYFGRVTVTGHRSPRRRPRLILASHRNGANDGTQVQAAFPDAQYLVSMQLLRNPFLRVFFTGIPVVRERDVERYGMDRSAIVDAVTAGATHLTAGGDLVVFPEGTSEWGHRPLPYKNGAARILRAVREAGVEVDVVPLGLFYSAPDRFGSLAAVHIGAPLDLDPRGSVDELHSRMSRALDAVSVNSPDAATFDRVQRAATARARAGEPFSQAFLDEQARHGSSSEVQPRRPSSVPRVLGLALMWLFWPVLLGGWLGGRKADARNTVTLFRMLVGAATAALWITLLVLAGILGVVAGHAVLVALLAGAGIASALAGHALLTSPRWQPDAEPLNSAPKENHDHDH